MLDGLGWLSAFDKASVTFPGNDRVVSVVVRSNTEASTLDIEASGMRASMLNAIL